MWMPPLWSVLLVLVAAAAVLKDKCAFQTAAILLANWVVNTAIAQATGTQFNWAAMATVDYLSAVAILCPPNSRWQIAIVALYAVEMIAHGAFAWTGGGPWPEYRYWYALHYLAWAQAACMGGWTIHGGLKATRHHFGEYRRVQAVFAVLDRVGSALKLGRLA